jgi:RNA polymerase sigma-70 factor (ECF subfamily)
MTDHTDPSKIKEYKELKAFLETKVSELPPDIGQVFRMHRDGGLTYPKIAEELEISVKTVEKKISIALRLLRKQAARSGAWDRQ